MPASVSLGQVQQTKKLPRIGFLVPGTASSTAVRAEAFLQALRENPTTANRGKIANGLDENWA